MAGLRLLFPLDGSDPTYQAVEGALRKAASLKDPEATFLVVMSKKLRDMPADAREHLEFDDEDELFIRDDEAKAVLQKAEAIAKKVKFPKASSKTVVGGVYDAILSEAKKHDVIVMHRMARDEFREHASGSILEKICRNAPCDVWLVNTK